MPRKPKRRRRKGNGWQVLVRVNGKLRTKQFPLNHPPKKMDAWADLQEKDRRRRRGADTLAADVEMFLAKPEIAAQPYVGQLAQRLALWVDEFGDDRQRDSITRDEIEAVIQRLLTRYKEPTVYHYRSALLTLFTTLDGVGAANPVKDTTCPRAWTPTDQSVPFTMLRAIVDAMPSVRYVKKGITQPSAAKLACGVIIAVGLRAADLLKVKPRDFRVGADGGAEFLWPASEKGQGVEAKWTALSPEGEAAFNDYRAAGMPRFNPEAISHSFKRAARRIDGKDTPIHLYSMRHSVGKDLYRETRDLATVGRMLNHAPGSRATAQYAQGANADVDRVAVLALSAARQEQSASQKKPAKSDANRPVTRVTSDTIRAEKGAHQRRTKRA